MYYELVLDLEPVHNNYVLYVCDDYYSYPVYEWKEFYRAWKAGNKTPIYNLTENYHS